VVLSAVGGVFGCRSNLTKAFVSEMGNFSVAQDINLTALAAWLHKQSEQAEAAADSDADEYGARATLETAARLAQASRIVKEAADQEGVA
jgi:hypothetical protein